MNHLEAESQAYRILSQVRSRFSTDNESVGMAINWAFPDREIENERLRRIELDSLVTAASFRLRNYMSSYQDTTPVYETLI